MDSVRKLLTGGLHEAVGLCLLLSVVLGGLGQTMHKSLTRRFGATATRLLSNFQAVVAWVFAVALFYLFRNDPVLGGIGRRWDLEAGDVGICGRFFGAGAGRAAKSVNSAPSSASLSSVSSGSR